MITIAICTYNNAECLGKVLESITKIRSEDISYEILIVDNNSTDRTKDVYEYYRDKYGDKLRYVFEEKQGLSFARNRALDEAKGEIVSYLDDDVIVDPGWLAAVNSAFINYNASLVGGKSYLIFPNDPPEWLAPKWESCLSKLDYGEEVLIGTDKDIYGLNYSLLRKAALDAGGFNTEIGRIGKKLFSYEEVDMQNKITANGGIVVYEPKAIVGHIVHPERLTKEWFRKRVYYDARSAKRLALMNGGNNKIVITALHLLLSYISLYTSMVIGNSDNQTIFSKRLTSARYLGGFIEYLTWLFKGAKITKDK